MYAMLATRPDLVFAVSLASHHMKSPMIENWQFVKRILCYIKGTLELQLEFKGKESTAEIIRFLDSNWAGNHINQDLLADSYYLFLDHQCVGAHENSKQ